MPAHMVSQPSGNHNRFAALEEDSDAPSYAGTGDEVYNRDIHHVTMGDDMSTIPLRGSESTDNTGPPPADGETQPGPSLEPVDRNATEDDPNQHTAPQDQTPSDDIGTDRPSVQQVINFFKHTDPMRDLGLWPQHIPFQTPLGDSTYNGTGLEYLEMVYLSAAQRLGLPLAGFQATRDAWLRHGLTSWSSLIEMDTKNFDDVTEDFHDYYEHGPPLP